MTFFSNAANFGYTYAWVLEHDKWLIPQLKSKFPKEIFSTPPDTRNPARLFGFEKSIMFAAFILMEYKLLDKAILSKYIDGIINWKEIVSHVKSFEVKNTEYEKAKTLQVQANKKARETKKKHEEAQRKLAARTRGRSDKATTRNKREVTKSSKRK
jgi:hypothetical protein